jgi:hypothetical protein
MQGHASVERRSGRRVVEREEESVDRPASPAAPEASLAGIQQTAGNRAAAMVASIQPKLVVGAAGDRSEREADDIADAVVRRLESSARSISGVSGTSGIDATETRDRAPARRVARSDATPTSSAPVGPDGGPAGHAAVADIEAARGSGAPLPGDVRVEMEGGFGAAIPNVRIHTDERAARVSRDLGARAFTTGLDIFFGHGEFRPGTNAGRRLLAHELAHTVQQQPGRTVRRQEGSLTVPADKKPEYRSDLDIRLGKSSGAGTIVRVSRATTLYKVLMSDGTNNTKGIPADNLFPATPKFVPKEAKIGTAMPGDLAVSVGDWLEPAVPAAYCPMYGVGPLPKTARKPQMGESVMSFKGEPYGAIDAAAVVLSTDDKPGTSRFAAETGDLFPPGHPKLEDIKQGELADCGLLAAIGSIMNVKPAFPVDIMKGSGATVTVKLFDIVLKDTGKQFVEKYVTVQRSSVRRPDTTDAFAQGALWVKILEKAYVAAGFLAQSKAITNLYSYASLEQMNIDIALGHLIGVASTTTEFAALGKAVPPGAAPGAPAAYPARGTAYDPAETKIWDDVKKAIDARKVVVIETRDKVTKKAGATGFSGGEQVSKGLVGGHAYSVLKTSRSPSGALFLQLRNPWAWYGAEYDTSTGRPKLVENTPYPPPPTGPATNLPVFWIDVRDVMRRFAKMTITDKPI